MVKNKMKSVVLLLLVFIVIFSCGSVFAQETAFTVMSARGSVESKSAAGKWIKIHAGDKIGTSDKIKLAAGDYLALVHVKGKTLELKKAGEYDAAALVKSLAKGDASFNQKFAGYVANEMVSKSKSKKMSMLGAVYRSLGSAIEIGVPPAMVTLSSEVVFSWYKLTTASGYVLRIVNPAGITIYMKDTKDTSLAVNLDMLKLNPNLQYTWIVSTEANAAVNSGAHTLALVPNTKRKLVSDTLDIMKKEMPDESSALNNFLFAKYFVTRGINVDALNYFEKAYTISGGAEEYAIDYAAFLAENGLTAKAELVKPKN
jgi:hypothetical protein